MSREVEKTLDSIGVSHLWKRMVEYVNGVMPKKTTDLVNDAGFITDFSELPPDQREALRGPRGLRGKQGDQGNPGEPGRGIESIRKTSSSGLTDTYTITFTDGSSYQYNVVNGKDGDDASTQGISYNDLNDKPTIPANLSELQDDAGHRTVSDTEKASWSNKSDFSGNYNDLSEAPDFKTINGESIIGTGDIVIQGGGGTQVQADWEQDDDTQPDYIKNKPTIPSEVTEITVAGWGFTKNTGDYSKPSGGIPSTDLSSAVQTSLGKADTAIQIETDPTVPSWAKQSTKPSYTASEVGAVPTSRTVNGKALSSNITLSASDVSALPSSTVIPVVPTNVSAFQNDAGYLTSHQDISGKEDKVDIVSASGATLTAEVGKYYTLSNVGTLAITLPTIASGTTKVQTVTFYIAAGSTPAVTFTSTHSIYYSDGFEIAASSTYEVSAAYNGIAWVVASVKIVIPT